MSSRRSRWIAGIVTTTLLVLGVLWAVTSGGSPLDSTADDGYLGLKLLLEQQGATVIEIDGGDIGENSVGEFDTVFVLRPAGVDRDQLAQWHRFMAAGGRLVLGEPDRIAESDSVTEPAPATEDTAAAVVPPGTCNLTGAEALPALHTGGVGGHHVHSNELSCYGDETTAIVTSATCLAGEQFTLSAPTLFDNATMGSPTDERRTVDRRGNATVAVHVLGAGAGRRIAIVTDGVRTGFGGATASPDEPACATVPGEDSLWQLPSAPGAGDRTDDDQATPSSTPTKGSTDERDGDRSGDPGSGDSGDSSEGDTSDRGADGSTEAGGEAGGEAGDPSEGSEGSDAGSPGSGAGSGQGESGDRQSTEAGTAKPPPSIFDFLSPGLKLALAQLLAVLVWYAWRRSRRRGVVVEDETPVELTSSRRVEAVGAFRRRGGESRRAGDELRQRTATVLAAELGLGRDAGRRQIAEAAAARTGRPAADVGGLLDGPPVRNEDELLALASNLRQLRSDTTDALVGRTPTP
jgi:hypothetical protein